jgi:hypothetical protein
MAQVSTGSVTASAAGARRRSRVLGAAGGRFGLLLLALVALMASTPLIIQGPVWNSLLSLFTGAVLVASLHAARPGGKPVLFGLALAVADFGMGRLAAVVDARWLFLLQALLWLSTLVFVTVMLLEAIFEDGGATLETLQASLCVYLLLGLLWSFVFGLIDIAAPGSFRSEHGPAVDWRDPQSRAAEWLRLFVFSFSTLSGTGFGDLAPASGFASNMASLEAMTGQIYLAVVIARLVGIYSAPPPAGPEPPGLDRPS